MLGKLIAKKVGKRAGQALKGSKNSARRQSTNGQSVRMSKDNSSGLMNEVASGKGAGKQASPAAQRVRKGEGRAASDLNQPAMRSLGKTADAADSGTRPSLAASKKANEFDKALAKKEKTLKGHREKAAKLKGNELIKYTQKYIIPLRASIDDMKDRGGPGGKSKRFVKKKNGGKIINKRSGGSMKKGLDEASKSLKNRESKVERSTLGELGKKYMEMGVMPAVKRSLEKKFMTPKPKKKRYLMEAKAGGKVMGYKKGGKVLKTNMSGDDLVRGCYD